MIAAAILLPLLIFLGLQFYFSARDQRSAVGDEALERAERILVESDAVLQRTIGALEVIGSADSATGRDWQALYERLRRVSEDNPHWATAVVTDLRSGRVLIDVRRPFGAESGDGGFTPERLPRGQSAPFVGGIGGTGPGCPCALVHLPLLEGGAPAYMVTAALFPEPFHRILMKEVAESRVTGVVDRTGKFVARSVAQEERVGRPATQFVRDAIARGPRGIYRGRTFEGFVNYTAYSTSALSGWSAHVAFSRGLLDSPRWRSFAAAAVAALASLLLAGVLTAFTMRQLSEGRRVQERLQEAQKMEALGQITGGIAHDFNNLLTPIIGGLEVISRKGELEGPLRRLLDGALSSARRGAKLTGQLLAFSRRQKMEIRPVDLPRLIEGLKPLLDQSTGPAVDVTVDVGDGVGWVRSDANQLELALLNLALNGRDAMPDGGSLAISARLEPGRRGAAPTAAIEVRDTGQGMPAEVLNRATEPFFTTKGGSGTGLGLAQVYGTIHQSGGTLSIDSRPGEGTAVTLRLPVCEAPPAPAAEDRASADAEGAAAEVQMRVILCDDDHLVRSFAARVLDEAGFVVESVSDGRSAVELIRNAGTDLLIVDYAMPGMNGVEVMRAVRRFRTDLPVLMITGYSDTEAVAALDAPIPVLRKPFDASSLLRAVRTALAADRTASRAVGGVP